MSWLHLPGEGHAPFGNGGSMRQKRRLLLKICVSFLCVISILTSCGNEESDVNEADVFMEAETLEEKPEEEEPVEVLFVYVCGHVVNPGVYEMCEGDRVTHAIQAAGGMTEDACDTYLNQAQCLTDGQMIYVPSEEEVASKGTAELTGEGTENAGDEDAGKVNLNTAGKEELMTLSGIGESRAEAILAYRQEHGGFQSIEEIKEIEGIKEGIFDRIKDQITV